ncbi:MFS transporter [Pseudomonas syringae group sp. J309-1]|uniref:MFS transporter n=1 Tax=Pseudomonas syringae group sp. J309-1 TaxID=3079588 RepID=UPI00290C1D0F|nr:MFS transporter [Pseudomonas syringae group sp. J309-1]MDU8360426.1 MFS transporter [Pseudomonas syringae group sp. J309-1]
MLKSATFEASRPFSAGALIWQLAQTFWVGGMILLYLAMLTVLDQTGLAPLLIKELAGHSGALLVGVAASCAALQMAVLLGVERFAGIWRDVRGQLLFVAILSAVSYYSFRLWLPGAVSWQLVSYLVLGVSGLLLVLQPAPGSSTRAR